MNGTMARTTLALDRIRSLDSWWLVWAPPAWLPAAINQPAQQPSQSNRELRERIAALRRHQGLRHAGTPRDRGYNGTLGSGPSPSDEDVESVVRKIFSTLDRIAEFGIRTGFLDPDPPSLAPRNPRAPHPKVKAKP